MTTGKRDDQRSAAGWVPWPAKTKGESKPAMRRVVSFGNGWHCGLVLPERIPGLLDQIKDLMEEAGRDFNELEITALAVSNRAGDKEIGEYRAAGVDVLYMLPLSNDTNAAFTFKWPTSWRIVAEVLVGAQSTIPLQI